MYWMSVSQFCLCLPINKNSRLFNLYITSPHFTEFVNISLGWETTCCYAGCCYRDNRCSIQCSPWVKCQWRRLGPRPPSESDKSHETEPRDNNYQGDTNEQVQTGICDMFSSLIVVKQCESLSWKTHLDVSEYWR